MHEALAIRSLNVWHCRAAGQEREENYRLNLSHIAFPVSTIAPKMSAHPASAMTRALRSIERQSSPTAHFCDSANASGVMHC